MISIRPSHIKAVRIRVDRSLKGSNEPNGPAKPNAGPTLPRQAAEAPIALGLGLLVLVVSTGRFTVSDFAVSTDIAGLRQTSSFGVVPLVLVREVVPGAPPADWPKAKRRGGWWPGRQRISVRHLDPDGETPKAFTGWVRDPAAVADALGHRLH